MMNTELKRIYYPQISQSDAGFKPVEFDQFGIIHPSKFIIHNSPSGALIRQNLKGLGYGE
jgi:hypothetical protein